VCHTPYARSSLGTKRRGEHLYRFLFLGSWGLSYAATDCHPHDTTPHPVKHPEHFEGITQQVNNFRHFPTLSYEVAVQLLHGLDNRDNGHSYIKLDRPNQYRHSA
jgi:hypothetical protein